MPNDQPYRYEAGRELRRRRKLPPGDVVEGGEFDVVGEAGWFVVAARLLLVELAAPRAPRLKRLHGKENRRIR